MFDTYIYGCESVACLQLVSGSQFQLPLPIDRVDLLLFYQNGITKQVHFYARFGTSVCHLNIVLKHIVIRF